MEVARAADRVHLETPWHRATPVRASSAQHRVPRAPRASEKSARATGIDRLAAMQQRTGSRGAAGASAPWLPVAGVAAAAVALLFAHAWRYRLHFADDAFISLRYAQRLLAGRGLTWTDGEAVEGYSNLLWTLLCAAGGALGFELPDAARALGALCGAAAVILLVVHARPRSAAPAELGPALLPAFGLAGSASLAAWIPGGLEAPLVAALVAWAAALALPRARHLRGAQAAPRVGGGAWVGVPLALLCWARPDGALFAAGFAAGLLGAARFRREALHEAARWLWLPALAVLLQQAFRLGYYGELWPNTATAKLSFSLARMQQGARYVAAGLAAHAGLALPALALWPLALRRSARETAAALLLTPAALWCAYVAVIGGDGFPAYRHLAPAVVLLAFLLSEGLRAAAEASARGGRRAALAAAAGLVLLAVLQLRAAENQRVLRDTWTRDAEVVGRLLGRAFAEAQPLLAVDPAGAVPFYSALPALDMLGLTDRTLAAQPPADLGRGWLGHELGNGAYVLAREPDLVLFCRPAGRAQPCFRSGIELATQPRFREQYRLVHLRGRDPHVFETRLWARLEGGRIGVRRSREEIELPAWFLSARRSAPAELSPEGGLEVSVPAGERAALRRFSLPAGRFELRARGNGAAAQAALRISTFPPDALPRFSGRLPLRIELERAEVFDLAITPADPGSPLALRSLHFAVLEPAPGDAVEPR